MQAYFGYGSNMDAEQMRQRCPGANLEGVALLRDYRLLITSDGYATIIPTRGDQVMGALWTLTASDETALDQYESIGSGLYRRDFVLVDTDAGPVRALVYLAANVTPGKPRPGYLEQLVAAARKLGLPEKYISGLVNAA